jgi:hypothetical protein
MGMDNGDGVIIASGHLVKLNVDQSGFTNGLLSLQIDGKLNVLPNMNISLKMNGNITGSGKLVGGYKITCNSPSGLTLVPGTSNTYTKAAGYLFLDAYEIPSPYRQLVVKNNIVDVKATPGSFYLMGIMYISIGLMEAILLITLNYILQFIDQM